MGRRSLLLGACCSFLAGIGACAVAAWIQLQRETREEARTVWSLDKKIEELEGDVKAARGEARDGLHHVESLLRTPTVSATDRLTDISAARAWLKRMKDVD
jgi:hypothetical protein